jgi:hypothetical protein
MNNQNKSEGLGETITISKYLFITYPIVKPREVWSSLTTTKKILVHKRDWTIDNRRIYIIIGADGEGSI